MATANASTIQYAGYGVYNSTNNATQLVQQAYAGGMRNFTAGNQWGGDPAPGERKYLYIVWNQGGDPGSGVTGEGDNHGVQVP
jgi:hypothetical protein